jgi:hypothetical protein
MVVLFEDRDAVSEQIAQERHTGIFQICNDDAPLPAGRYAAVVLQDFEEKPIFVKPHVKVLRAVGDGKPGEFHGPVVIEDARPRDGAQAVHKPRVERFAVEDTTFY